MRESTRNLPSGHGENERGGPLAGLKVSSNGETPASEWTIHPLTDEESAFLVLLKTLSSVARQL